jgi:hypothetical protein
LRNREGILIEKAADELDEIATAFERDIAVQKLDRESRLLRQILAALSLSRTVLLERACTVMTKSAGSVRPRCPGRHSARCAEEGRPLTTGVARRKTTCKTGYGGPKKRKMRRLGCSRLHTDPASEA